MGGVAAVLPPSIPLSASANSAVAVVPPTAPAVAVTAPAVTAPAVTAPTVWPTKIDVVANPATFSEDGKGTLSGLPSSVGLAKWT